MPQADCNWTKRPKAFLEILVLLLDVICMIILVAKGYALGDGDQYNLQIITYGGYILILIYRFAGYTFDGGVDQLVIHSLLMAFVGAVLHIVVAILYACIYKFYEQLLLVIMMLFTMAAGILLALDTVFIMKDGGMI